VLRLALVDNDGGLTGQAQGYAAIYRFSQHRFTTCLVMAAEMGPETHLSGNRHV
jgi:hypothetical protein